MQLATPCHRQTASLCRACPILIGGEVIDKAIAIFRGKKSSCDSPPRISENCISPTCPRAHAKKMNDRAHAEPP
jgi:hypothetical protein